MSVLQLDEDELVACVACGLCLPHCPTYRVTGLEVASPRGRIAAMQAVQLGGAGIDATFERYMEECVQCRGCEAACPSSVPFGHLMEGAREALQEHRRPARSLSRRFAEWVGYGLVLPRHWLLVLLSFVAGIGQRLHVVPRRLGLPWISLRSLREPLRAPAEAGTGDAYLFPGCVMDTWQREAHRAALRVMAATGSRSSLPRAGADCCGALHAHAGRIEDARRLARRVIASMPGGAPVVVDSAGCGAAMKDYGRLLGTPEAETFARRVRDFSEWLAEQPPLPLRDTGRSVIVQDPCHLRHVQRAADAVRAVLAPAYRTVDTNDDGLCCGAGGAYSVLQRALASEIRDRKIAAIRAVADHSPGAERSPLVASSNPGCAMHLFAGGLYTRHPAELLADALDESDT
jgi:glycolate oxidase iron-sulfur subunit